MLLSLAVKINTKKSHIFSSISSSPLVTLCSLSSHQTSPISFTGSLIQVYLSDLVVFVFKLYAICHGKSILILFSPRSYSNFCSCLFTSFMLNFYILKTFSFPQRTVLLSSYTGKSLAFLLSFLIWWCMHFLSLSSHVSYLNYFLGFYTHSVIGPL